LNSEFKKAILDLQVEHHKFCLGFVHLFYNG